MRNLLSTCSLAMASIACVLALAAPAAQADSRRVVRPNAAGGTTATAWVDRQGPFGGSRRAARAVATDGQGHTVAAGRRSVAGPQGGSVQRAGRTEVNADGSAHHAGSISASGARGTLQSSGSATRDAAGQVDAGRTTSATSAATGNSVQSSASYNSATGLTRSTVCYDASGATIACR